MSCKNVQTRWNSAWTVLHKPKVYTVYDQVCQDKGKAMQGIVYDVTSILKHRTQVAALGQRSGLQSLQWYHDSNRIPVYGYTGIQGLQIVYRGVLVGIQVYKSTESLQKVYRYHTCALKQEAETQQTNSEGQKSKPRQRRAFWSSAFNVF